MALRTYRKTFIACLLLPTLGVGVAARPRATLAREDASEYQVKRTYTKGEINRYRVKFETKVNNPLLGGEAEITLLLKIKEETREVTQEGVVTLDVAFEEAALKSGKDEFPLPGELPQTTRVLDKEGKVLKEVRKEAEGPLNGGEQLLAIARTAFLPTKNVKIGDEWNFKIEDADNKEVKKTEGKGKLLAKETLKGLETLKIHWNAESTLAEKVNDKEKKLRIEGDVNLEKGTGRNILVKGKIEGDLPMGAKKATLQMELWTPEDEKKEAEKK